MRDSFGSFHPIVNFLYFVLVIGFSLALTNPIAQIIAFFCALIYAITINNRQNIVFLVKLCLPMVVFASLINPLFNHRGATILLYFSNGNPLTLESFFYGLFMSLMLVTVFLWFSCFNKVITTDKFIYLFGKIIPSLSLVLSMSLRFLPRFKKQMQSVIEAQKGMGKDITSGSLIKRMKIAVSVFSIMLSWVFENAIDTADSMKSRGYGLKKRTACSIYRFDKRDKYTIFYLLVCAIFLCVGAFSGVFSFSYFPDLRFTPINLTTIPFYIVYFLVSITPIIINLKEEIKWKTLVSKI